MKFQSQTTPKQFMKPNYINYKKTNNFCSNIIKYIT